MALKKEFLVADPAKRGSIASFNAFATICAEIVNAANTTIGA